MRDDLRSAVALVRTGKTYSEAALELGLTRNQVGGACKRAGFKVSGTAATSRRARIAKAKAELMRTMRNDPEFNNKRLEALRRSRANPTGLANAPPNHTLVTSPHRSWKQRQHCRGSSRNRHRRLLRLLLATARLPSRRPTEVAWTERSLRAPTASCPSGSDGCVIGSALMELLLATSLVILAVLGLLLWRAIRRLYWATRAAIQEESNSPPPAVSASERRSFLPSTGTDG